MGALDDILDEVEETQGSGGGADFWNPKKAGAGKYRFRLYRFGEGNKELVRLNRKHFPEEGQRPESCTGETCRYCRTVEALSQNKDKMSLKQADQMRLVIGMAFVVVLTDTPDGYKLWEASSYQGATIMVQIAKASGWSGPYPNKKKSPDEDAYKAEMAQFKKCVDESLEKVCGSKGMDLCVTYSPNESNAKKYTIDIIYGDGKELPFEEDEDTPDPQEIWDRIAAARS